MRACLGRQMDKKRKRSSKPAGRRVAVRQAGGRVDASAQTSGVRAHPAHTHSQQSSAAIRHLFKALVFEKKTRLVVGTQQRPKEACFCANGTERVDTGVQSACPLAHPNPRGPSSARTCPLALVRLSSRMHSSTLPRLVHSHSLRSFTYTKPLIPRV